VGWFAREADLLRLVGQALLPAQSTFPHFQKLLLGTDAFELLDDELHNDMMQSIHPLLAHCSEVKPISLGAMNWERFPEHLHHIRGWEAWRFYGPWIDSSHPNMAADIRSRFEACRPVTAEQHEQSLAFANDLSDRFNSLLGNDSLLCIPTTASIPPKVNASSEELQNARSKTLLLTAVASVARLPQVSIPVRLSAGFQFGLSLIARQGADMNLLDFCADLARLGNKADEP
jgi:amidase